MNVIIHVIQKLKGDACFQDGKAAKEPAFSKLTFGDSGLYECEVSIPGLVRRQSFELFVEGR